MIAIPSTVIENVDQLREYLQAAIQLEHATIPPYLTAAYTADMEKNRSSVDIITTVAREEMLHFTLAANLLNAIGGEPNLIGDKFVPHYPTFLPTGQDDFDVGIEKFSNHAIETFLKIERPTSLEPGDASLVHIRKTVILEGIHLDESICTSEAPFVPVTKLGDRRYEFHYDIAVLPHDKLTPKRKEISEAGISLIPRVPRKHSEKNSKADHIQLHFWNIGEFYRAIHLGFVELTAKVGEKTLFCGLPKKQIADVEYWGGGDLTAVIDLNTALKAIDLIAGQGEGSSHRIYDDEGELAHYYRFDQIQKKQYYRDPNKEGIADEPGYPQGGIFAVDMEAVWPIKANAKIADYGKSPQLKERALLFNGQYKRFLETLHEAFNGKPELLNGEFHKEMRAIGYAMTALIRNPIPETHEFAAPTFEMDQFTYPPVDAASKDLSLPKHQAANSHA